MDIKKTFNKNKSGFIGGFIGLGICILLFIFYTILFSTYYRDKELTQQRMLAPAITGHLEVFAAGFLLSEDTPISQKVCKQRTICSSWTATRANISNCQPYTLESGENGCCQNYSTYSDPDCTQIIGLTGLIISALILCVIYFLIGFFITKKLSVREIYQ